MTNTYQCICLPGFYGDNCEHKMHACYNQPCKNQGACRLVGQEKYKCECKNGWNGENCEVNIDDCKSNPCKNQGVCVDKIASYECKCLDGYSGKVYCLKSLLHTHQINCLVFKRNKLRKQN